MHCLHCGKQLALFKKLREDAFCSADHRQEFFENHQRIAVERLKSSAARLKARRYALLNPPADPEPAYCGFLAQVIRFEEHDWQGALIFPHIFLNAETGVQPPSFSFRPLLNAALSRLLSLPLPSPFEGRIGFVSICPEAGSWSAQLAYLESQFALAASPSCAEVIRARGVRLTTSVTVAMERPEPQFGFVPSTPVNPPFAAEEAKTQITGPGRMLRLSRPALSDASTPQVFAGAHLLAARLSPVVPSCETLMAEAEPQMVARVFRARARSGVDDLNLTPYQSIQATPESDARTPSMVPLTIQSRVSATPAPSRLLDGRAQPVDGRHSPVNRNPVESLSGHAASPRIKGGARMAENALLPPRAEKFFKARPSGPVQGLSIPGWETIETTPEAWPKAAPELGQLGLERELDAQPAILERVYRMRPRGPVPDRTSLSEAQIKSVSTHAEPVPFGRTAVLPGISTYSLAVEPVYSEALFQPRLQTAVESSSIAAFASIAAEALALNTAARFAAQPGSKPDSWHGDGEREPALAGSFFSPQPQAALEHTAVAESRPAPAYATEITAGDLRHPSAIVGATPELEPSFLGRMFRARPRGIDTGSGLAPIESRPMDGVKPVTQLPATPAAEADFEPAFLDRLFRPRPRGGVADPALPSSHSIDTGAPEPPSAEMIFPEMPALLMRHNRVSKDKPIRMRPRQATPNLSEVEQEQFPDKRNARQVS